MSGQSQSLIVIITWGTLFGLYALQKYLIKDRLVRHSPRVHLFSQSDPVERPGTLLSKTGVLFVFAVNILTFVLIFVIALSPSAEKTVTPLKMNLPLWMNTLGITLFVFSQIWGFFALVFNPNYTPLYKNPPEQFVLATRGPYRIMRHPRYASEALLNIALFLLTGFWLPLLGLPGWIAIYHQSLAEESYLMKLATKEYGEYRRKTGMFIPKIEHFPVSLRTPKT